jgi:hypothetical protein
MRIAPYVQLVLGAGFCGVLLGTQAMYGPAQAQVNVSGQCNIFGAGHAVPPSPGGGGGGTLPTLILIPEGSNRTAEFSSVTGTITYCSIGCPPSGADGIVAADVPPGPVWDGLAGVDFATRGRYLAGVFLDDTEPSDPAPGKLKFVDGSFAELAPGLRQIFFIGDGMTGTGSGSRQVFHIPDTATRLFLGFQDRFPSAPNLPGAYGDNSGNINLQADFYGDLVAVEEQNMNPSHFVLHQNRPNPFNPSTTIRFDLDSPARLSLRIFDLAGRLVCVLEDESRANPGTHHVTWTGRDDQGRAMPPGTYFYQLTSGPFSETRGMTLIK